MYIKLTTVNFITSFKYTLMSQEVMLYCIHVHV